MEIFLNLLPYGLLLLAAVIAFFMKGNIVNKILNLVLFAAGMFCICAESGWWRFAFILLVALWCAEDNKVNPRAKGIPCFFAMGIGLMFIIIAKWVLYSLLSINPTWVLIIISLFFSWMLLGNVGYENKR